MSWWGTPFLCTNAFLLKHFPKMFLKGVLFYNPPLYILVGGPQNGGGCLVKNHSVEILQGKRSKKASEAFGRNVVRGGKVIFFKPNLTYLT